ncbi:3-hydroxyacyl-CoA dehydrogenase family protein [Ureibacillus chungkukjangi]|uniref:3-hydroxyacyl-CoA dehydrogenase family protein n=1 Tax=Ureibacillus chungkukjangi TaxID=1202712 RepID=UPI00203D868D|nr:3-hydroxyacyl-CoA dehydrogenase family protein [Ureibacillus chungkukjangi]MCM3386930.1 3-hydroxyacyl-CoA dehydrogenase family protein [Ureibacillus chungkukjangi]
MIKKVGVIGAGTMGFGIAFQFITNGFPVVLQDIKEESLNLAKEKIKTYLTIFREEEKSFKDSDEVIFDRLTLSTAIQEVADCDLVIESATENLELKQKIFRQLDEICAVHAILTSNTSSLKLSDIIRDVEKHKDKVMLTHFFNPAHIVPLVELLKGPETNQETYDEVNALMEKVGKVTIEVRKEMPGLVANRIQTALAREALSLLEEGVVSEKDLESAIFAGPGFRFATSGLLKIMDFGGLDVWDIVMDQLQPEIESNVCSFGVIKEKTEQGHLGVKASKGIFEYPGKGLDDYVIERDRSLIQQLKTFDKVQGGN